MDVLKFVKDNTSGINQLDIPPDEKVRKFIINKLTPRNKGWEYIPGEIIVTLSDRKKVEPLLNRFEKISRRLKKTYKWKKGFY